MSSFRRVAIAGAGRGIGAACAGALAGRGAREIFLCARTGAEVEAVAAALSARFPEATVRALVADLATDAGARSFAAAAGPVDLAIIAAGSAHRAVALDQADRATLLLQLESNALAPALAAGALLRAGARQLLFLSSLATRRPPMPGAAPYTAGKAALEAFVRAFAEECWPHARANALCLGPVRTRLHELAGTPPEWVTRFASPDEVAPLVIALAEAGVTGRIVDADALLLDPAAALAGDGHLAQAEPLAREGEEQLEPEPGRRPSPRVRAALRATAAAVHRYPGETAALAARIAELHGVPAACVALSGGGAGELLERTLRVFCSRGDEVLSPFPTFELLSALCTREGLRHRPVPSRRGADGLFGAHAAAPLTAAVGPRTRLLYIASPDNPTGAVLPAAEEALLPAGLLPVILDEAWAMEPPKPAPGPLRALRLRSLSKLHGLAGLRIGYALGPEESIGLLRRLELPFPLGAPQVAAALAALADPERARRTALVLGRARARLAQVFRAHGLAVSDGPAPILLVRGERGAIGRLLFALQAARLPVQQAHWDEAALVLGLGSRAQNLRAREAVARALGS